jgi:hypothetical protein
MKATFDPAQNLDLYFRRGRNGSKLFSFFDSGGLPFSLEGLEFEFKSGFGVTLTILDNTLEISIADTENPRADSDFWELINTTFGKTWLCGTAYFTSALSAAATDIENITIVENGEPINITLSDSGSGGVEHYRGPYDASTNLYPDDGGSGAEGVIQAGDRWYFSVGGTFEGVPWQAKTLAEALVDDPGQDSNNWRLI